MVIAFRKISFLFNLIYKQYCIINYWIILIKKIELLKKMAFLFVHEIVSHGNIKNEMMSSTLLRNCPVKVFNLFVWDVCFVLWDSAIRLQSSPPRWGKGEAVHRLLLWVYHNSRLHDTLKTENVLKKKASHKHRPKQTRSQTPAFGWDPMSKVDYLKIKHSIHMHKCHCASMV